MPSYDVRCTQCNYSGTEMVKLANLDRWDQDAVCPQCHAAERKFSRVILAAPFSRMGGEGSQRVETARKLAVKADFTSSGKKAEMLHKNELRVDRDQAAACREAAKKG